MKLDMHEFLIQKRKDQFIKLYGAISIFLLLCCFLEQAVVVFACSIAFVSIFNSNDDNLKLIFFCFPFQDLLVDSYFDKYYLAIVFFITFVMGVKYVSKVVKKEKKFNWKLFVPITLILIYIALPIHKIDLLNILRYVIIYALIYLVYETREEYDYVGISKVFVIGFILCGLFGLFEPISLRLQGILPNILSGGANNFIRYSGVFCNPNKLAANGVIAITLLLVLLYNEKISMKEFIMPFTLLFAMSFLTVSRLLIFVLFVEMLIFGILYLVKYKKKAISSLLIMIMMMLLVCLCLYSYTVEFCTRFLDGNGYENKNVANQLVDMEAVLKGEQWYDPGRIGIYKLYLTDIFSSVKMFLFGKGASAPLIGMMAAHNIFLQFFWYHGLIGTLLLVWVFLTMINFKAIKKSNIRNYFLLGAMFICLYMIEGAAVIDTTVMVILFILLINLMKPNKKLKADV